MTEVLHLSFLSPSSIVALLWGFVTFDSVNLFGSPAYQANQGCCDSCKPRLSARERLLDSESGLTHSDLRTVALQPLIHGAARCSAMAP